MSRAAGVREIVIPGFPRLRGDEPMSTRKNVFYVTFFPPMRG